MKINLAENMLAGQIIIMVGENIKKQIVKK
jgi:hypothetical protein